MSTSASIQMENGVNPYKGMYCCKVMYCDAEVLSGKQYCSYHSCRVLGCDNQLPCSYHSCKWRKEKLRYCAHLRTYRGEYCIQHSCRIDGCLNYLDECETHKKCCFINCSTKLLSDDIKYCPSHICGVNGCKDGLDECIIHTCLTITHGVICGNSKTLPWKKCLYHLTYDEVFDSTEYAQVIPRDVIGIVNKYISFFRWQLNLI